MILQTNRWQYFERYVKLVFSVVGVFVLVIAFVRFFVISPGVVNGWSMEPNYVDEDFFFVNRFVYLFQKPQRQDVVQLIEPENGHLVIKRIIGLPGDIVIFKQGKIFIQPPDGEEYELDEAEYLEPYVLSIIRGQVRPMKILVEDDYYYMLGDNRPKSTDSRAYRAIHRSRIVGKVISISSDNNEM